MHVAAQCKITNYLPNKRLLTIPLYHCHSGGISFSLIAKAAWWSHLTKENGLLWSHSTRHYLCPPSPSVLPWYCPYLRDFLQELSMVLEQEMMCIFPASSLSIWFTHFQLLIQAQVPDLHRGHSGPGKGRDTGMDLRVVQYHGHTHLWLRAACTVMSQISPAPQCSSCWEFCMCCELYELSTGPNSVARERRGEAASSNAQALLSCSSWGSVLPLLPTSSFSHC